MRVVLNYLFPNCKLSKLGYPTGKKITTQLLKNRKILKNRDDLKELDRLLSELLEKPNSDDEDEEDEDEDDEDDNVEEQEENQDDN